MSTQHRAAANLRPEPVRTHEPTPPRGPVSASTAHLAVLQGDRPACASCRAIGPRAASRCGHYPAT